MKRTIATAIVTLTYAAVIVFSYTHSFTTSPAPASWTAPVSPAKTTKTSTYGKVPLSFERNDGQTDAQVKFLSRGAGYALFLTETEAVLRFRSRACKSSQIKMALRTNCQTDASVLRMRFEDANLNPQVSGSGELEGKSNYLNLDGAGEVLANVPNFEHVNYAGLYKGIELVFYGNERQLEYDFNIEPNADPRQIKLKLDGAESLFVDAAGNLVATVSGKDVQFKTPVAYQTIKGERRTVAASYAIENQTVRFELGDYDESETLVIDPILQYSSYLGGSDVDFAETVKVNAAGEAYVAGSTYSANFPKVNAVQPTLNGTSDGYLTKFNAAGTGVVFSTYLGGADDQSIYGIALDAANNITIAGLDSRNGGEVYVGELNAAGTNVNYPTVFIGGTGAEYPTGLGLDAAGNAYVTGATNSTDFQTTAGVVRPNKVSLVSAFAIRINANGALAYSTFLNGTDQDSGSDIAVDGAGNAYIVGQRYAVTGADCFILKLNPTATAFAYPVFYFGGTKDEVISHIEIDGSGNAYVTGQTDSTDFPTTAGVIQPAYGGGEKDGFVAKINANGNSLTWATYLGSIGYEDAVSLKRDSAGNIYVTGESTIGDDYNFYVLHLNSTATAIDYNAQFGDLQRDQVREMTLDAQNNIYLAGETSSNEFLTTANAFQRFHNGGDTDGFIMKIAAPQAGEPTLTLDSLNVTEGSSGNHSVRLGLFLSSASSQVVTVRYQTAEGTAKGDSDFITAGTTLAFAPGETSKQIFIPIVGDTENEPEEYFTVQLLTPTNAQTVVPRGRVTIINDDDPPAFNIGDVSLAEGNSGTTNATFDVSLSSSSGNTVAVNYATSNGTATAPTDFTATSGTLTFAPGTTSKTVTVPIVGDTLVEANESFNVNLSSATNATIADAQGLGTITNDDAGGSIQFAAATYSVNEAAGNISVTVTRSGGAASGVSIKYAATNGTATGAQDFTASNGTVVFGANETSKTFDIAITNDTLDENNETVNLTLSAPGGGATLGSPSSAVLTIIDDDTAGSVQFSAGSASVNEAAGNITLIVTRTSGSASGVSVNYATQNGTATAGQDFTSVNGTIAFGAAETSKTLVVPLINDSSIEGNETFAVNLGSPSGGATLGTPASIAVTIIDNDSCSYSISPSSQSAPATSSNGTFSVIAQTGCAWTAASNASWLTITGGASGSGNGSVDFIVAANTGATRVGTITAAGQIFTVSQSAAPNPTPTPTPTPTATPTPTPTATPTPTPSASPTPTPNAFQFSAASYQIGEGDLSLAVNIIRSGDTSGVASVSFATNDLAGSQGCTVINGVASSRCDYEVKVATVTFAPGEASRTISVFIIDDSFLEGVETFTVNLSNASGAGLGGPATATVSVTDNEMVNGNNPVDTASFFVRQHYLDFLNREADSGGLNFWTGEITQCGANAPCLELKRVNVSAAFYLSIEFQETGYLVERLYKTAYGDAMGSSSFGGSHQLPVPIIRLSEFLPDTQEIGQGVVVGQTGWDQVLENNKQAFAAEFVQRLRFTAAYPEGTTPAQFVDRLNMNAGNPLSLPERDQLVVALSSGTKTRAQVLRAVAEDSDFVKAESNRAFVLMQYFGYLRRNPDDPQDTDYSGYDFWLTKLNQFNGNFVNAEMVKSFITSGEYRQRFGPTGGRQGGY